MNKLAMVLTVSVLTIGVPTPCNAQLYGVTNDGNLITIDTQTAAATVIGNTGVTGAHELAYDPVSDTLFLATTGGGLYRVNRGTGQVTLVASGVNVGQSLTWAAGFFYSAAGVPSPIGGSHAGSVWKFDASGGNLSQVGDFDKSAIFGLAVHRQTGEFYAAGYTAPLQALLFKFTLPTSPGPITTTYAGSLSVPVVALGFVPDGTLYGSTGSDFLTWDPSYATFSQIPFTGLSSGTTVEGLASVTETQAMDGSGTPNYLAKFTGVTTLGNSIVFETNGQLGVSTTTPTAKLDIAGDVRIAIGSAGPALNAISTAATGSGTGAYVEVQSPSGRAVHGVAANASGNASGGRFEARGVQGTGVYAEGGQDGHAAELIGNVRMTRRGKELRIAQAFETSVASSPIAAGNVVVIDSANPGKLTLSTLRYDRKVAGVAVEPATAGGSAMIAVTGMVSCFVDASGGQIRPGDLLTTSSVPGHARKATDLTQAQGAILGKALEGFGALLPNPRQRGKILILVTLQ